MDGFVRLLETSGFEPGGISEVVVGQHEFLIARVDNEYLASSAEPRVAVG